MLSHRLLWGRFPVGRTHPIYAFSREPLRLSSVSAISLATFTSRRGIATQSATETPAGAHSLLPVASRANAKKSAKAGAGGKTQQSASTLNPQPRQKESLQTSPNHKSTAQDPSSSPPTKVKAAKAKDAVAVSLVEAKTEGAGETKTASKPVIPKAVSSSSPPPPTKSSTPSKTTSTKPSSSSPPNGTKAPSAPAVATPAKPSATNSNSPSKTTTDSATSAVQPAKTSTQPSQTSQATNAGTVKPDTTSPSPSQQPKVQNAAGSQGAKATANNPKSNQSGREDAGASAGTAEETTSPWPRTPLIQLENFFLKNADILAYDVTSRPPAREFYNRLQKHNWDWAKLPWLTAPPTLPELGGEAAEMSAEDSKVRLERHEHFVKGIEEDFWKALIEDCDRIFGDKKQDLGSWHRLCGQLEACCHVGLNPPPGDVAKCREAVERLIYINLTELIVSQITEDKVTNFTAEYLLSVHTLEKGNTFPQRQAHQAGLLRFLLRNISNPGPPYPDGVKGVINGVKVVDADLETTKT